MNENFLNGLKLTREIEHQISQMHDIAGLNTNNLENFTSELYTEQLQEIDSFFDNINMMINKMNGLINEMKKKIDSKEESKGIWEM